MNMKVCLALILISCFTTTICVDLYRISIQIVQVSDDNDGCQDNSNNAANAIQAKNGSEVNNIGQIVHEINIPPSKDSKE
ncbi:unnamed protein product [Leptosia nina]|uniref:Uncharacterized protein n=1 Tax=Leptosia nina TaxID=320188 RepID=A0AAV1JVU6_9NEOP